MYELIGLALSTLLLILITVGVIYMIAPKLKSRILGKEAPYDIARTEVRLNSLEQDINHLHYRLIDHEVNLRVREHHQEST